MLGAAQSAENMQLGHLCGCPQLAVFERADTTPAGTLRCALVLHVRVTARAAAQRHGQSRGAASRPEPQRSVTGRAAAQRPGWGIGTAAQRHG